MSYGNNVYYDPDTFGLRIVAVADAGEGYDFSFFVVWRNEEGQFLWASDLGCSCPTPFEDTGVEDLHRGTQHEAIASLQHWAAESYNKPDITNAIELLMQER